MKDQFEMDFGPKVPERKLPDIGEGYLSLFDQPKSYISSEVSRVEDAIYRYKIASDVDTVRDLEEYLEALNKVLAYKNVHEDEESA